jgi:hypothetical protein
MTNPKMKTKINFSKICKAFLVAGLLAAPCLAFKAEAEPQYSDVWSPYHTFTDSSGNSFAYWNDPENWSLNEVPTNYDTYPADIGLPQYTNYIIAQFNQPNSDGAYCVVTNDAQVEQLQLGVNGGYGEILVTNGATFQTGFEGEWTGVGFPEGPSTLILGPGTSFSCGSHLWIGQGTANPGVVIDNGGAMHIGGQFGPGWNGTGGTNYVYVTNNGTLYLNDWSDQTLGAPAWTSNNLTTGILDIDTGSSMVITNNYGLSSFQPVTNTDQLIANEGTGTIIWSYNSADNLTTVSAVLAVSPNTPLFSVQPTNTLASIGSTVTLSALVSNVPVNYGWYFNGSPVANGSGISGANTANLTITGLTAAQTGSYSVYATNSNAGDSSYFVLSAAASVSAQSFGLYPVVTLNGTVGNTYEVQYTSSLTAPVTWTTLGTYTTISSPQYVPDFSAPLSTSRFYQVIQTGTAQ